MDLELSGKRAFVSGSTQGIGYAIARALLDEGATVVVNGRRDETVQSAVRRLKAENPGAAVSGIAADFGRPAEVARLLERLGEVDILVNNVGIFEVAAFDDIPDDDWQRYFDVNMMSGVRLARNALPRMLSENWGRIIFIGTESAVNVPADMLHYGTTKAAMLALSNGLAKLTRGTEVTVNTILGGPTYSDGVARAVEQISEAQGMPTDDLKAAIIGGNQTSLLQRFIDPSEIANLAVYLASPLSSATNGAALRADGGVLTTTL
ncbi:SDR family NAD(P)-dependent oxidoreductase [Herbiconiux ginsengi]|uniref:NAD(P)-dependent dehydrogenase, short-chain alcohol dehydrogenase family n=1 Tax=Herbiconiux ginsengi TaxID=381665 RepID=A0A1H3QDL3_9MICO|nr:SDR family oxidoreductase [Herbiconiux ginsengi]SDZ11105.1 NAD(P)-dependent dehydrogenase, short-chain alcohol dehydrogenase family [Herbiconiux ginsengi]